MYPGKHAGCETKLEHTVPRNPWPEAGRDAWSYPKDKGSTGNFRPVLSTSPAMSTKTDDFEVLLA